MINCFSTSFEGSFFQLKSFEKNSENPTCSAFQSKINSFCKCSLCHGWQVKGSMDTLMQRTEADCTNQLFTCILYISIWKYTGSGKFSKPEGSTLTWATNAKRAD